MNRPPELASVPDSISLAEGELRRVHLDARDEGEVTVTVTPGASVDVDVVQVPIAANGCAGCDVKEQQPGASIDLTIRARYGPVGADKIVLVLRDAEGLERSYALPVAVTPVKWGARATWTTEGPEAREHGSVIVDEAKKRVLVIGGSGYQPYGTPLGDVWSWSLTSKTWTKHTVEGEVPKPAGSRRVARVTGKPLAYLHGGYAEGGANLDELWEVDFANDTPKFRKIAQASGPTARALHGFAYDAKHERFVLFGGASGKPMNDTWTLKISGATASWAKVATEVSPSARYGFFQGLDPVAQRFVIFSGATSYSADMKAVNDAWALDLSNEQLAWSKIEVEGAPRGRRNGCFVMDETSSRLFVFGGTADAKTTEPGFFVLDVRPGKESWTKIERPGEPALRSSGFGYWDPDARAAVCGFGNTTSAVYADWTGFGVSP